MMSQGNQTITKEHIAMHTLIDANLAKDTSTNGHVQ